MPLPYDHYVLLAIGKLNAWGENGRATGTQQQTLTLALTMAICDLTKELHEHRRQRDQQ